MSSMLDLTYPLEKLSLTIARNAIIVSQYLAAHNLAQPSSSSDGPSATIPTDSPQSVHQAREDLIVAALEILQVTIGPSEFLPHLATSFQYISCLRWLCQFNIFHLIPLNRSITYVDLAAMAKVPEQRLKSVIRMARTTSLFQELPDGTAVDHSATSALLARNEEAHSYAWYMSSRTALCALQMSAAHKKWGAGSLYINETAFNLAFDTEMPFFEYLSHNEEMMKDFAQYMRNVRSAEGVDIRHLLAGFEWQSIPEGGTVVDIGGSTGTSAIALAKAYPHLILTVQDLPANAESERENARSLPANVASRITFQAHDFKAAQPVQGADVYLLRMILHDWPDDEATSILENIVAARDKRKSRLLIMDTVLPRPGSVPVSVERVMRARDMVMIQAFNSKEQDPYDWIKLLVTADLKLQLVNVVQPFGSLMSVLELALT